jgi:glucose/arabinose dehydrogenase
MAESTRSIVINLTTNLHAAFDTEHGRVHTIWLGEPLNLFGPPYSHTKTPAICTFDGERTYSFPPLGTWYSAAGAMRINFTGLRSQENFAQFHYEAAGVKIAEMLRGSSDSRDWTVTRTFEFSDAADQEEMSYLAFAEGGAEIEQQGQTLKVRGTNGMVYLTLDSPAVRWSIDKQPQRYEAELITDAGTEKGNPILFFKGPETRAYVRVPRGVNGANPPSFSVIMSSKPAPLSMPARAPQKAQAFSGSGEKRRNSGDEYFQIEHFPLPPEQELMITGMDWLNSRDLAVCTWLGEIYLIENATGPVAAARYRRYARGLNEPLGLTMAKDQMYVVQKGELTRISDTDGNGEADWFHCLNDDWGYSGNYHSYSFGPLFLPENEFMVFITGQRGRSDLAFQGCALRVNWAGAKLFCSGLRVPHGWGTYQGDIFVTDNQGNWIGACKLNHLQEGKFYGFQLPGVTKEARVRAQEVEPPVLWFPRSLSASTSGFDTCAAGSFGPFGGQMFIGDFQNSIVMRACLEKVRGKWQGAVFPFAKGFLSGVNRLKFGPDGKLYVGGGKRTWSTAAPKEFSLDRVSFTGKVPFEVAEVRAVKDGFELRFTKPLEAAPAKDAENYLVKQFTYEYHEEYGSPEFDHEGKPGATETAVAKVQLSTDQKSVRLTIPKLKTGFVTAFQLAVNSAEDEDLRHDQFYYTLNQIPE